MAAREQVLIYAAYRVSPELGQATKDIIRGENPTEERYDRLYKLLTEQIDNPRIGTDIYLGLIGALKRRREK